MGHPRARLARGAAGERAYQGKRSDSNVGIPLSLPLSSHCPSVVHSYRSPAELSSDKLPPFAHRSPDANRSRSPVLAHLFSIDQSLGRLQLENVLGIVLMKGGNHKIAVELEGHPTVAHVAFSTRDLPAASLLAMMLMPRVLPRLLMLRVLMPVLYDPPRHVGLARADRT